MSGVSDAGRAGSYGDASGDASGGVLGVVQGLGGVVGEEVTVTVCPDGPLLVRGPAQLRTVDGTTVSHERPVIALCRCGRSRVKPLCDGSHRLSHFRDPATPEQLDHVLRQATPLPPEADGPEAA